MAKKGGGGGENTCKPTVVEEETKKENKKDEGGGSTTVVLKVDMHCEGCTKRIINSVKGVAGLEKVNVDSGNGKLTVIGRVDPIRIRERVERKTRKKVELISPLPKKKEDNKSENNEKKAKEPPVSTVVLKIQLHCEGCTDRIRRKILKIKGVASVCMDTQQDLVTVRGTMEVKTLPAILTKKLKRAVEIAPPKKEKNKKDGSEDGGEKKENNGGSRGNCNKIKKDGETDQYCPYPYPYPYYIEMMHAPQLFSDENPNFCSVM